MKNKLLVIFPIGGPPNGVKIITKFLLEQLDNYYKVELIDIGQAQKFDEFGKFSLSKIKDASTIFFHILKLPNRQNVYLNLSVKGFSFYRDMCLIFLLLLKGFKITIHIHANGLEEKKSKLVFKLLNKTKIIVINDYQFQKLIHYDKISIVSNSLPDYYGGSKCFKIPNKRLNILYFSNVSIEKGAHRLLKFCESLIDIKDKINITICGGILDNESKEIVKRISNLEHVVVLDPIFDIHDKMKLFRESDVFIFLSDVNYEVFPLVYLEALMNGLPIITTDQIISEQVISNNNGQHLSSSYNREYIVQLLDPKFLLEQQNNSRVLYNKISNFKDFTHQIINILNE